MYPWLKQLKPLEDELLSSFLSRATATSGVALHTFMKRLAPGMEVWTRDVDRSASPLLIACLAPAFDLSVETLQSLTLQREEAIFNAKGFTQGTGRLLLSLGIHHRTRRRFGLQYCPACLDKSAHFKKEWRYAFVIACDRHHIALRDHCVVCQAPVIAHRAHLDLRRCWRCKRRLTIGDRTQIAANDKRLLMARQLRALLATSEDGKSDTQASSAATREFARLRGLIAERESSPVNPAGPTQGESNRSEVFESLRHQNRLAILVDVSDAFLSGTVPKVTQPGIKRRVRKPPQPDALELLMRQKSRMPQVEYARQRARLILTAAGLADELD